MSFIQRNSLLALLVFTYVFSTVGISFVSHYCGGELQEVSVYVTPDDCCGGEAPEEEGCCKNETDHVVMHADVLYTAADISLKQPVSEVFVLNSVFEPFSVKKELNLFSRLYFDIPPPDLLRENLISTTVLRI